MKGGAIKFRDEKTKNDVALQNSEVREISKEAYREAVGAEK